MSQTTWFLFFILVLFPVQPVTTSHPMVISPLLRFPRFAFPSCLFTLTSPSATFASGQCHPPHFIHSLKQTKINLNSSLVLPIACDPLLIFCQPQITEIYSLFHHWSHYGNIEQYQTQDRLSNTFLVWKCAFSGFGALHSWAPTWLWLLRGHSLLRHLIWPCAKYLGEVKSHITPHFPGQSYPWDWSVSHLVPLPDSLKRAFLCPLLWDLILHKSWKIKMLLFYHFL